MMDEIAIDACIFIHLFNPQNNKNAHIDRLLAYLLKYKLLVDSTGKIAKDYQAQVIPMLKGAHERRAQQLPLLRQWMLIDRRTTVNLNPQDQLMTAIKKVIDEIEEHADRAFVYVACKNDADLITNDEEHILDRREAILDRTKRYRGDNTTLISSLEAYERIPK